MNKVYEGLIKEAKYWQNDESYRYDGRENLMRIYGKAQMAVELKAISHHEFMNINEMTVRFINENP